MCSEEAVTFSLRIMSEVWIFGKRRFFAEIFSGDSLFFVKIDGVASYTSLGMYVSHVFFDIYSILT